MLGGSDVVKDVRPDVVSGRQVEAPRPGLPERGLLPPPAETGRFRGDAKSIQLGVAKTCCESRESLSLDRGIEGKILPPRLHRESPYKGYRYRCSGSRGLAGRLGDHERARILVGSVIGDRRVHRVHNR